VGGFLTLRQEGWRWAREIRSDRGGVREKYCRMIERSNLTETDVPEKRQRKVTADACVRTLHLHFL